MKHVMIFCLLVATSASAQVARVFLAGTGNDAGDCTNQATPCRSLQGAVTACPVNGEIIILDNGGYDVLNVTASNTNSNTVIENSRFEYNTIFAVDADQGTPNLSIRNSVLANNVGGVFVYSNAQTMPALVVVDTCTIAHNSEGIKAVTVSSGSATMRVTNSTIYHNVDGIVFLGTGVIESYGNNRVTANTNNSTFSGTIPLR